MRFLWQCLLAFALALSLAAFGTAAHLYRGLGPIAQGVADRALPNPIAADQAPLRLTAFGTSLTEIYDWPEGVSARLSACLNRPVLLTRVAKSGQAIDWGHAHVDEVIASAPDVILMEFSVNDGDAKDGIARRTSQALTAEVIETLQAALPESHLVLMTMNPAYRLRGILRFPLAWYYDDYRAFARHYDLGLIDAEARWRALPHHKRLMQDGVHPEIAMARSIMVPAVSRYLGGSDCEQ